MEQPSQSTEMSAPTNSLGESSAPVQADACKKADLAFQDLASQTVAEAFSDQTLPLGYSVAQVRALSPISLAYIGDAVFELYVRSRLLMPAKRIRDYHRQVVAQVKAEQQSDYVDWLMDYLTPEEADILRRGRNATTGRSRRAGAQDYQKATGFEALIGFLYLSDQPRMLSLLALLKI